MTDRDRQAIASFLREQAGLLGFAEARFVAAAESPDHPLLLQWIESGYAAEMEYFRKRQDAYRHPDGVMPGTKTILVLLYPYPAASPPSESNASGATGRVARYVWPGDDYHDVIFSKLKALRRSLNKVDMTIGSRGIVDTAPLMEREVAELAGLGWRGKNTLLLNRHHGSYFFLACLLLDVELVPDVPHATDHCGTCTACLDACPTDAFVQPHLLDASRCISYLTIEHRDIIPQELRQGIGDWLFGCDVCQDVCPWNRKPSRRADEVQDRTPPEPIPLATLELIELLSIDDESFRKRFRKTPLWRARRRGMVRNAAIVAGNLRDPDTVPALSALLGEDDAMLRATAVWALRQVGTPEALEAVEALGQIEQDPIVLEEIRRTV